MADDIQDDEVVENNKKNKQDNGPFSKDAFLQQVRNEQIKKEREALKGKVSGLLAKRKEAQKAVTLLDKEIEDEIEKFQQGLA